MTQSDDEKEYLRLSEEDLNRLRLERAAAWREQNLFYMRIGVSNASAMADLACLCDSAGNRIEIEDALAKLKK